MLSHRQFMQLLNYEKMFDLSIMERDINRAINDINRMEGLSTPHSPLWQNALHLDTFLHDVSKINDDIMQQIKKYWTTKALATKVADDTDVTIDMLTAGVKEKIIAHLEEHQSILYHDFLSLVGKNKTASFFMPEMFRLYRFEANGKAFLQIIEEENPELSYALLTKKIYSVFMQIPLDLIGVHLQQMSICLEEGFHRFLPNDALKTIKLMA